MNSRLNIRISRNHMSFSATDAESEYQVAYELYPMRSGIASAANLREAFGKSNMLNRGYASATLLTDAPYLLVPIADFQEEDAETLYRHTFSGAEPSVIMHSVVPELNVVAVFPVNKDLRTVIEDHYRNTLYMPLMQPVWTHLHRRNASGNRQKLYAYFHDNKVEVISFLQNRFRFCNAFDAKHTNDAIYFILNVWKQLALDSSKDELYIGGNAIDQQWLSDTLHRYLQNVYFIHPSAEFNRAPVTRIVGIPFDLIAYYMR